MPGRVYSAQFNGVAVTALQDFFEVVAASTKVVEILEVHLSQLTEVADAAEEMLLLLLQTGATTSGSGGSSPTVVPREFGMPAFAGTVEANNTTRATAGTIVTHEPWHWNVRIPFSRIFTPDTTIWLPPSARFAVGLPAAPTDSITMGGCVVFKEYG